MAASHSFPCFSHLDGFLSNNGNGDHCYSLSSKVFNVCVANRRYFFDFPVSFALIPYKYIFIVARVVCIQLGNGGPCCFRHVLGFLLCSCFPLMRFLLQHFVCSKCEKPFYGRHHYEKKGLAYCEIHYHQVAPQTPADHCYNNNNYSLTVNGLNCTALY